VITVFDMSMTVCNMLTITHGVLGDDVRIIRDFLTTPPPCATWRLRVMIRIHNILPKKRLGHIVQGGEDS